MVIDPDLPRPFDPEKFALRLERARKVVHRYKIQLIGRGAVQNAYEIGRDKPYFVVIDRSGRGAHDCSCPDGAARVIFAGKIGSLCKHVLACILKSGNTNLLMPFLCVKTKSGSPL